MHVITVFQGIFSSTMPVAAFLKGIFIVLLVSWNKKMLQTKHLYLILDNVWKILVTFYIMIHVVAEYRCIILTVPHITMDIETIKRPTIVL